MRCNHPAVPAHDNGGQKGMLERALSIQEQRYGGEHYEVARTLANLAHVDGALGDLAGKQALLERVRRMSDLFNMTPTVAAASSSGLA